MNKPNQKALTPKDVVDIYPPMGCVGSLANMRCKKVGPKFYRVNSKIIYKPEDIEAYLFQNPVQTIDSARER